MAKRYVNRKQLSEILGIPERTIKTLMERHKIRYRDLGHRTKLFVVEEVEEDLDRREARFAGGAADKTFKLSSVAGLTIPIAGGRVLFIEGKKRGKKFYLLPIPKEVLVEYERKRLRERLETLGSLSPNPKPDEKAT